MSLNKIRRIVSGKKARFTTDTGSELDLCYITDRILICGWPASGVASLYRNDRSDVRKFLRSRYGTSNYRIFNFVPRFENEYDAAYFDNSVSRFPFPDHHPPPLSLIPLVTRRMHDWLSEDEKNVVVIHCKAGKGRSGTMCCCYLLSLPTLPQPPQLPQNLSRGLMQEASPTTIVNSDSHSTPYDSDDSDHDKDTLPRQRSGGAALDLAGLRGEQRHRAGKERIKHLVDVMAVSGDEAGESADEQEDGGAAESSLGTSTKKDMSDRTADLEAKGMAEKLQHIFDLHTAQRMKPQKPDASTSTSGAQSPPPANSSTQRKAVRGVSIPSQRRFVGYWSRVLTMDDPRPLDLLAPPNPTRVDRVRRQVRVIGIRVQMPERMPGFPNIIGKQPINIHLARYNTKFIDGLEKRELELRELQQLEKKKARRATDPSVVVDESRLADLHNTYSKWDDNDWDDTQKMFENQGSLTEVDHDSTDVKSTGLNTNDNSHLVRHLEPVLAGGIRQLVIDADREVQIKFLIGHTGRKHSVLPDVGSLGYMWLIPSFECSSESSKSGLPFTATLDHTEIDFFKKQSGIQSVEIDFEWVP